MQVSPESVSPREAEVLALLAAHLSNAQIAGRLHISVRTVENHVAALLRKHGVADRRALAAIAGREIPAHPAGVTGAPTWRTGFTGRAHERDAILALLRPGTLVTLAGPGGVGKTRLAAVVAEAATADFPGGGAFVDLVPVREGQVAGAVARALDVNETPGQSLEDAVTTALGVSGAEQGHGRPVRLQPGRAEGDSRRLLILDNCEHLLDDAAALADLVLSRCPDVTVLATSRERLGVPGERVVPISPLPLASDAEALFADRAAAGDPGFVADPATVAEICARLDGMPLAIELAAARCASLGAAGLLAALDDTLRLLAGSRHPDERHRSLRAVIGWSHDLLADDERTLFPRLAVFAGAFDLDAACHIAPFATRSAVADVLGRLVDKSLVVRGHEEGSWRLLETVRAYALDRLTTAGDLADVRDLHLCWAADTAHALAEQLHGPAEWSDGRADGRRLPGSGQPDERQPDSGQPGKRQPDSGRPGERQPDSGRPGERRPPDAGQPDGRRPPGAGPTDGRKRFDAVCGDLRAALRNAPPGPGVLPHRLARSLGHLAYDRRLVSESLEHFKEAARRAPTASAAAADLRTAAQVVYAVGLARGAFDLLLESADRAADADDHGARVIALAQAVVTACRFTSGFADPIPRSRLRTLLTQAATIADPAPHAAPAGQPDGGRSIDGAVVGAHVAAASTWCPGPSWDSPDPVLAEAAVAAARVTGDPVLISAALDATGTQAIRAGRFRQAYRIARERLALVEEMDRRHPASAAEILDSFHNAWLCAFAAGDLLAALSTAELIAGDELLGAHPYRSAGKLIPPLVLLGRFDEALELAQPMWQAWRRSGTPIAAWLSPAASAVALAHGLRGDHPAYRLWQARAEQALGPGNPAPAADSMVFAAFVAARVAVHTGEDVAAPVTRAFAGSATGWPAAYARAAGAELAVLSGLPDADRRLAAAAETAGENDWAAACLARARGHRYGDAAAYRESLRAWTRIDARFEREHTSDLLVTGPRCPA
ncbi:ATP-binding protein [Nonomuraea jiangxiensis]|uniref:Predicted ATPase n=1 Tax=Nonomuraea jiangxiensis TaxID=633440 RepID=A0A1G8W4N5_9ACTN|nr:LuxR C-terminal-related transcriptional regulator [Nonomuraea jiangxiensis]SDJ73242.1 Predicted ATPase [Nonomuraea jiangxiensis]